MEKGKTIGNLRLIGKVRISRGFSDGSEIYFLRVNYSINSHSLPNKAPGPIDYPVKIPISKEEYDTYISAIKKFTGEHPAENLDIQKIEKFDPDHPIPDHIYFDIEGDLELKLNLE